MKKLILISILILGGLFIYGHEPSDVKISVYDEFITINTAINKIVQPGVMSLTKDQIRRVDELSKYRDALYATLEKGKELAPDMNTSQSLTLRKWYYWMCSQCSSVVWCGFCGSGSCCGWSSSNTCTNCGSSIGTCRNILCN